MSFPGVLVVLTASLLRITGLKRPIPTTPAAPYDELHPELGGIDNGLSERQRPWSQRWRAIRRAISPRP
jgi:hypothetical protein